MVLYIDLNPINIFSVLENGLVMYIWLGSQLDPTFVQYLFGLETVSQIQPEKVGNSNLFYFFIEIFLVPYC